MKRLRANRIRKHSPKIALVVGLVFVLLNQLLLAAIILIVITSLCLPLKRIGIITRAILTMLILSCITAFLAYVTWYFHIAPSAQLWVGLYLIIVSVLVFKYPKLHRPTKLFTRDDLIAGVVTLMTIAFLVPPFLGKHDAQYKINQLSHVEDDIAHFGIVHFIDKQNSYLYGSAEFIKNGITPNLNAYPQGWHFNVALWEDIIDQTKNPHELGDALTFFFLATIVSYAFLVYLFVFMGLTLLEKKTQLLMKIVISAAFSVFVFLVKFSTLLATGFQTQIYATALVLGALLMLLDLDTAERAEVAFRMQVALLFVGGSSLVWLLPWPVGLIATALVILIYFKQKKLPLMSLLSLKLIVLASLGLIQVIIFSFYNHYPNTLNERGGVAMLNIFILGSLSLLAFAYIVNYPKWQHQTLAIFICASIYFSVTLGAYQLFTAGEVSYYFYKSLYLIFIIVLLVFIPMMNRFYEVFSGNKKTFGIGAALTILAVGLYLYANVLDTKLSYFPNISRDSRLISVIGEQILRNPDPTSIYVTGLCSSSDEWLVTRLITASTLEATYYQTDSQYYSVSSDEWRQIQTIASRRHLTVVTSEQFAKRLNNSKLAYQPQIFTVEKGCNYAAR